MSSDLGGSADAPTVPRLRPKAKNSAVVHTIGNETSAALTQFGQSPTLPTPAAAQMQPAQAISLPACAPPRFQHMSTTLSTRQRAGDLATGMAAAPDHKRIRQPTR